MRRNPWILIGWIVFLALIVVWVWQPLRDSLARRRDKQLTDMAEFTGDGSDPLTDPNHPLFLDYGT